MTSGITSSQVLHIRRYSSLSVIIHNKLNVIVSVSSSYSAPIGIVILVMCVKSTKQPESSRRHNSV